MNDSLRIHTLGVLTFQCGGQPVIGFVSHKVEALLVYLASTRRAHAREVLAEMFWSDRPQGDAARNLRVALANLRKTVAPFVTAGEPVGMSYDSEWWLDVMEFEARLDAVGKYDAPALQAALDLYQGEFLSGFYVNSQAFEDWAMLERERLRLRAMEALDRLIGAYLDQGDYASGIMRANQLLAMEDLREKTYRHLMRLLWQSGEREAALVQYETCCRLLDTHLGTRPTPQTVTLFEQIMAGEGLPNEARRDNAVLRILLQPASDNLPAQATTFVGRDAEIADLLAQLDKPDCRLLTLVGPGGIGKTRLAMAVAERQLGRFPDGVFFVDMVPLITPEEIPPTIASAIGCEFSPTADSLEQQLADYLRPQEMLLVLDGFERLLASGAALVDLILSAAPGVKILATSREAFNLGWEWRYDVEGLIFPDSPATPGAESYDAIRLFAERARQARHDFSLADNLSGVVSISQLVEGMPLGIELAAAWLRVMSCDAIRTKLIDLETLRRDMPERHRSLRGLFEHAWGQLSMRERDLLMKLTIFRGGFTWDAAETVADALPPVLAALVNKSLLRADHFTGRYTCHRLIHQFAAEKLAEHPEEVEQAHTRQCAYFADFLDHHTPQLQSPDAPPAMDRIEAEIDNIREAWNWAITHGDLVAILKFCVGLGIFYGVKGWNGEALEKFRAALALVTAQPDTPQHDQHELALQLCYAVPLMAIQGYTATEVGQTFERVRQLAQQVGDLPQLIGALAGLAPFYGNRAEWRKARALAQEAYAVASQLGNPTLTAASHVIMHYVAVFTGDVGLSLSHKTHLLALSDSQPRHSLLSRFAVDPVVAVRAHGAWALWALGYPDQAVQEGRQAYQVAETMRHPFSMVMAGAMLITVHILRHEPDEADRWLDRVIALSAQNKFEYWLALPGGFRGWILLEQGNIEAGIASINKGVAQMRAASIGHFIPQMLAGLAWGYTRLGRLNDAWAVFQQTVELIEQTDERSFEAETYRLMGELLWTRGDLSGCEELFHKAIGIARQKQARSWELRAAVSCAHVWRLQERHDDAQLLLEPIYHWFTEGLDTVDLREARSFLAAAQ
jgi:predicted ATPase/DNA-binding SARP family transcriptional activator